MGDGATRREFGRLAGLAGMGMGGAVLLSGCAEERAQATPAAAARTWKATGRLGAGLSGFDSTMKSFMKARNIPCGSLAVVRKGKLVLARGYTWTASTTLKTQPTSLLRVASLSKPMTAAAVLKLVQDGELKLTDRVTDLLTLTPPAGQAADPRLSDVTVLRLLQHLGGWDHDITPDPMYRRDFAVAQKFGVPFPVSKAQIAKYVTGLPLDRAPGTAYAYSNYGYMLLGLIIEKASGQSYATYVQNKILKPRGITRMKLGRPLKANRATGEVPYYSQYTASTVVDRSGTLVAAPYGAFNLENMAAHGGWLGTAVDMVRFAGIFDAASSVLSASSISRAFAKPATGADADGSWYGCGWNVRAVTGGRNTWHTGSLPGTSTLLVRRYDGLTWAVLFNQRDDPSGKSYDGIDLALHKAADAVGTWPSVNYYGSYF